MDEAENGTLWFGNEGGVASYDGVAVHQIPFDEDLLSKITHEKEMPLAKALLVLPDGNLLVLIGESLLLRKGDEWTVIIPDVGPSTFGARLTQTDNGTIWLLVPEGLWQFSGDLTTVSPVMKASDQSRLLSYCIDVFGDVWVVQQMKNFDSRLVQIPIQNGNPAAKADWREFPIPFDNEAREACVVSGEDGLIWYVNDYSKAGLQAFDPREETWIEMPPVASAESYFSILKLKEGSILAGSMGGLLHRSVSGKRTFYSHVELGLPRVPLSLFEADDGRVWVMGRIG